jgi:hypothetical protein
VFDLVLVGARSRVGYTPLLTKARHLFGLCGENFESWTTSFEHSISA